jgi:hypothetical protein
VSVFALPFEKNEIVVLKEMERKRRILQARSKECGDFKNLAGKTAKIEKIKSDTYGAWYASVKDWPDMYHYDGLYWIDDNYAFTKIDQKMLVDSADTILAR